MFTHYSSHSPDSRRQTASGDAGAGGVGGVAAADTPWKWSAHASRCASRHASKDCSRWSSIASASPAPACFTTSSFSQSRPYVDVRGVVAAGIVPVRRRLAFRELSIVDVGRFTERAGNRVPYLRPADGEISIAMDRRASDGAVVSTHFDMHMPQRGASVFHLALASLPISTIVSLKLRVGDQSPQR